MPNERTGDLKTLEQAIANYEQALELTPENHPDRLALFNNLGSTLFRLYERTGVLDILERAIANYEQALELTPENHPDRASLLNNFGAALARLHERAVTPKILERAIAHYRQALRLGPEDHPRRPGWLNNLGVALLELYRYTRNKDTLAEAIGSLSKSLKRTPENHSDRASFLNNLGHALTRLYEHTDDPKALKRAVELLSQSLERAPKDHPDRASRLNNLGIALLDLHELAHEPVNARDIVERAAAAFKGALKRTPQNHPARPSRLSNLGNACVRIYKHTNNLETRSRAIGYYREAVARGANLNPGDALMAGWNWIQFSFEEERWLELEEAYGHTIAIMRWYAAYQTDRSDLAHTLSRLQTLPSLAARAQVELGNHQEAVTALESGRTFVLREALERGRRDLERLPELGYPDLYERFEGAKRKLQELERAPFEHHPQDWLSRMNKAREELERAAREIREKVGEKHPEYRFLMNPLPFSEIQDLAANAPLVYLFATPKGGCALVVRKAGDPQVVRLPRLTERGLLWMFRGRGDESGSDLDPQSFQGSYDNWRKDTRDQEKKNAWFQAVEKTLDFLGEALTPLREFLDLRGYNRVTLIPAGILAALPLHAARFKDGTYFLEHYTFSYVPSAHALYYACPAEEGSESEPLLAVENPNGDLHHAALEVEAVREHFARVEHFAREEATVGAVRKALPEAGVFHFSGHGAGGWGGEEPRLQLADGVLTLSELLRFGQTLDRLRLAVLSACETGVSDLKAPNEYLGLPAGFLLAGASGVVGSLWSVPDVETALLVVRFYEKLCSGKTDSGKVDAAEALREAQTWMLRMSPEEKRASLARLDAKPGNGARMSPAAAEGASDLIESGGRKVKHPYYWAAFGYYGVPVELEGCGKRREG